MHASTPLVSIIMPAYNAQKVIGRTLESVIAQSYPYWELIVVDDCSRDATRTVVTEYAQRDARIQLLPLASNYGAPAGPRNIGIQRANSEWIALLDADDIWHPKKLELQMSALLDTGASFCSTRMLDFTDDRSLVFQEPQSVKAITIDYAAQRLKNRIPTSSVVIQRKIMMQFPFNEDMRYKAVEDYHCWLRIHEQLGTSIKLNYPLLNYRRIAGQLSGSKLYMLRRIFMLHRDYPQGTLFKAVVYTLTYALGGFYYRILGKKL